MADPKSSNTNGVVTLSAAEVGALADRLAARGASLLFPDAPGITADMVLAAKALRKLVGEIRAQHTRLTEVLLALSLD